MTTYLVYIHEDDGTLQPVDGEEERQSVESKAREPFRKTRERAIAENEALQRLAATEQGVNVVLIEQDRLTATPLRGTMSFRLG